MKIIKKLTLAAMVAMLVLSNPIARAAQQGPLRVTFVKCFAEDAGPFGGHFEGTVGGDLGVGTVLFTFVSVVPGDVIWQFSGLYEIAAPGGSFTALATGIDALRSGGGHDVLNGEVIAGAHLGAQVQVRAHDFYDASGNSCSQGTITITPSK